MVIQKWLIPCVHIPMVELIQLIMVCVKVQSYKPDRNVDVNRPKRIDNMCVCVC